MYQEQSQFSPRRADKNVMSVSSIVHELIRVPRDEICHKEDVINRYIPRILVRRFALTRTAYKYLDIGIRNHIILPHETWEIFIKRRVILSDSCIEPSSLRIEYLVMEHVKIHDTSVVKLTVDDSCLYMKPAIILFLFKLKHCVNHKYLKLYENTEDVNARFDQFVRCLQSNMPSAMREDAVKILRDVCDKTSIIDCELVAYAADELLCETLKRCM
ncbi:hypothetical protein ACFW04_013959 [Cataglyphis niger]